ncbi:MAG: nitroreductase family protein [Candidatus Hecatellales archaeon]|nr:MAG: nitroreductase family protein [Candidatus Hecatellales archaeon]
MEVFEAIYGRRSIRSFRREPIPKEYLTKILDAARWAPSAGNVQPWEFIVVTDGKLKEALARAALNQYFTAEAPVAIVVCADLEKAYQSYGVRGETLYCLQDTAAAVQNMLLAAYALGLGSCWVGAFNEEAVSRILGIPEGYRPVAIVPLGFPAESPGPRPRRSLRSIVHMEKF